MNKHEGERLIGVIRELMTETGVASVRPVPPAPINGKPGTAPPPALTADGLEGLYRQIKARLIDDLRLDPVLLELIAKRPEIEIHIEPQRVTLAASTLRGRVARLIAAGWFGMPRKTGTVRSELSRTGADPGGGGSLSGELSQLQRDGFLTKEGDAWQAAQGIKITEKVIERTV